MNRVSYIGYSALKKCFPVGIEWDEQSLILLGYRGILPFARGGDREPKWQTNALEVWFSRKYRKTPELVKHFCAALKKASAQ